MRKPDPAVRAYRVPHCETCGSAALDFTVSSKQIVFCLMCEAKQSSEITGELTLALAMAWTNGEQYPVSEREMRKRSA